MPNFDMKDVANYETVTTHPHDLGKKEKVRWHPVTHAIIYNMMAIQLGKITKDNLDEVYFRTRILQLITGAEFHWNDKDVYLTKEDFELHIGLRTNVSDKSREQFLKTVFENHTWAAPLKQSKSAFKIAEEYYVAHPETAKQGEPNGKEI